MKIYTTLFYLNTKTSRNSGYIQNISIYLQPLICNWWKSNKVGTLNVSVNDSGIFIVVNDLTLSIFTIYWTLFNLVEKTEEPTKSGQSKVNNKKKTTVLEILHRIIGTRKLYNCIKTLQTSLTYLKLTSALVVS